MENFNSLFEQFFGDKNKKSHIPRFPQGFHDMLKDLGNFMHLPGTNTDYEAKYGKPIFIETFYHDGIKHTTKTYNTENGGILKVTSTDSENDPINNNNHNSNNTEIKRPDLSLEKQLEKAVKEENYLKAAKIRDQIVARDKPITPIQIPITKRTNKKKDGSKATNKK